MAASTEVRVNKSELIDEVHSAAGGDVDKKDVATVVDKLIDVVERAVARGDKVTIPGFGAWSRTQRAARTGRNPRTGEPVQIAASKGVKFSAGASFKSAVNK
ncbi:MAG TPA: HU family DNA-binding protein [Acidimicrobiia bacterium]|nr:HU family DNA-binding protein [Acidimicrobiia bacterium]